MNIKKACKTERDIVREAVALGKYEKMKVLQTMYDITGTAIAVAARCA